MNWKKNNWSKGRFHLYLSHRGNYFMKDSSDDIKKKKNETQSHKLLEDCIN